MDETFSAEAVSRAMLRFEAALALGLADAGIAPRDEAEAVATACEAPVDDAEALLASTWDTGTPLIELTQAIRSRLTSEDERRWVHHGATSQDAIDTAYVLLSRQALETLDEGLTGVAGTMRDLIEEHEDQPHMARTFLQDARATTFGLRVAGWLEPLLDHLKTLRTVRTGLALQLGGPAGNLAQFESGGARVVRAVADRLELAAPLLPWHTDRSRIRAMVNAVKEPVDVLAKVALDVSFLAQSSIGELRVRAGGSSSMPEKANPVDAIRILTAAGICRGGAAMVLEAGPHELDRSLGSWQVEWVAVPAVFQAASAAVDAAGSLLTTLEVDSGAMSSHAGEEAPPFDPTLIDSVLDHYSQVVEGR
jgi:3-carboxy-cis,cis-muconate cycloisomerase